MKQTAIKAAKLAGRVMLDNYGSIGKISFKGSKKSILTKIDLKAEKIIINTIKQKFPDHNIISEESGRENNNSDYSWIIDPIDGTTNYVQEIPDFCVSIGLAKNNKIILGVIYMPLRKELFFAEKGKGAFFNNKKINASKKDKIIDSILGFSLPSKTEAAVNSLHKTANIYSLVRGVRNSGSAALNLCNVACGRYDMYFSESINSWDAAAGFIIVEEAGGKVTDLKGNTWTIKTDEIVSSNKILHEKFLRLLNK